MHQTALSAGKVEQGREKLRAPSLKKTSTEKNLCEGGAPCLCKMHTKEKIYAKHCTSIEGAVLDKQL